MTVFDRLVESLTSLSPFHNATAPRKPKRVAALLRPGSSADRLVLARARSVA
ncbi:hypothetical protein [Streptomyces anulatus]|uniref:hypothetical protein n=1 Tax=Streptomyces anulatus TaxID=1892 RepID=UPI0034440012